MMHWMGNGMHMSYDKESKLRCARPAAGQHRQLSRDRVIMNSDRSSGIIHWRCQLHTICARAIRHPPLPAVLYRGAGGLLLDWAGEGS